MSVNYTLLLNQLFLISVLHIALFPLLCLNLDNQLLFLASTNRIASLNGPVSKICPKLLFLCW